MARRQDVDVRFAAHARGTIGATASASAIRLATLQFRYGAMPAIYKIQIPCLRPDSPLRPLSQAFHEDLDHGRASTACSESTHAGQATVPIARVCLGWLKFHACFSATLSPYIDDYPMSEVQAFCERWEKDQPKEFGLYDRLSSYPDLSDGLILATCAQTCFQQTMGMTAHTADAENQYSFLWPMLAEFCESIEAERRLRYVIARQVRFSRPATEGLLERYLAVYARHFGTLLQVLPFTPSLRADIIANSPRLTRVLDAVNKAVVLRKELLKPDLKHLGGTSIGYVRLMVGAHRGPGLHPSRAILEEAISRHDALVRRAAEEHDATIENKDSGDEEKAAVRLLMDLLSEKAHCLTLGVS